MFHSLTRSHLAGHGFSWRRVAIFSLVALSVSGCSTTKTTDETLADKDGEKPSVSADGNGEDAAKTAATSPGYVDPYVSVNQRTRAKAAPAVPSVDPSSGGMPATAAAPSDNPSGSIVGLATQPTGVRAGSFSIFSSGSSPAAASPAGPAASDQPAAVSPPGQLNAASRSVFSSVPAPSGCGTDAEGQPLSC